MSRRRLTEVFKASYGMTITEYIRHVRMQHARNLLRDEEAKVADVARRLGYSASSNFARDYRREFKCAPHEDVGRVSQA